METTTQTTETTNPVAESTSIFPEDNKVEAQPPVVEGNKEAQVPEPKETATETTETDKTKTPEPKGEADPNAVPEKYELKVPENSGLDASVVERISSEAKEKGLTNGQAQELLNREHDSIKRFVDDQKQALETRKTEWVEQLKSDKELGGENFASSVAESNRVIKQFFPVEFQKELETTGLGNYPHLVRGFARIGKAMAEDKFIKPGAQAGGEKAMEDYFYNGKKQN